MKNSWRTDWRRLLNVSMRAVLALVVVGMLVVPVAVQADLKATAVVYAWDFVANKFQNSNVIIPWDGTWIPFLHELNFDKDLWVVDYGCSDGESTRWAGTMEYGLYHLDDNPAGAPGFQESQVWSLVSCDRNGDGSFDNADLSDPLVLSGDLPPSAVYERPEVYAECTDPVTGDTSEDGDYCRVLEANPDEQDVPVGCGTGNCALEIVTTLRINLDQDCDGAVDQVSPYTGKPMFPVDEKTGDPVMLCFYAEARTPTDAEQEGLPPWSNPLQARISAGGGDKTVTFNTTPTAVELAAFEATAQGNGVLLTWETASEIDNLGFNLYRADSQVGQLVKINANLIASQNMGSAVGAAYSFLDESAVPGTTYYYWVEDIDASGTATKHGPAVARTSAAKALPGRPRPAPMPGNAF
jgi:hypothetical protein